MRSAAAIGRTEARHDDACAGMLDEVVGPNALQVGVRRQEEGHWGCRCPQVVDVPAQPCPTAKVPSDPRPQPAWPPGAADVQIHASRKSVGPQGAYGDALWCNEPQRQSVGTTGSREDRRLILYRSQGSSWRFQILLLSHVSARPRPRSRSPITSMR